MSTWCVLILVHIFFTNFVNYGQFHKIKCTQKFILNSICKDRYTLSMQKIHFSRKYIQKKKKKKLKKCWLIQLFPESINNNGCSIVTCLSCCLSRYNCLFILFSLRLKFINSKFSNTCHLPFAKINTRKILFLVRKNKYTWELVHLRYAKFLSDLSPLSFSSSGNTLLD